jgi:Holliday junction resolvase RusA-like endonuclease
MKNPIKKGRLKGQHVMTYTPTKTQNAEKDIRSLIEDMNLHEYFGRDTPIRLEATFFRAKPKSRKEDLPTQKPDWDNFGKLLTDALQNYIYENDSQITTAVIRKRYALRDTEPRIYCRLSIDSIDDDF